VADANATSDSPGQVCVIHLSDLHFGAKHVFTEKPVGPGRLPPGEPTLLGTILNDLKGEDPGCPVIVCITGDFAEKGDPTEFRKAEEFIRKLADAEILGKKRGIKNIFIVPGNHDLVYSDPLPEDRWTRWTDFYNHTFAETLDTPLDSRDVNSRISFHNRISDLGVIVLCLNSAEYVEKGTSDERRGVISEAQLAKMKAFLQSIPSDQLETSIRIALIHHHPVLIPGLAESEAGYDAVEKAGSLLNELRNFGFHLVLHGHKHLPYHFSEDSYTALYRENNTPILIVAGGSAGSTELPRGAQNYYNRLAIKWIPKAKQGRILLSTKALQTTHEKGRPLLRTDWKWVPSLIDDRQYIGGPRAPQTFAADRLSNRDNEDEQRIASHSKDVRFNMAVCEVMPSLIPGQHNEVRLWIEFHGDDKPTKEQQPIEVTWSAGQRHQVISVQQNKDSKFCATLHYDKPMLVQAQLRFADGHIAYDFVYARMITTYKRPDGAIDIG
jgi:3',5'-cyclic AMP phosphodiesterase CpdA